MFYISILLTIFSNVIYHLFQKSISPKANPLVSLAITYITAAIISVILFPFFAQGESFYSSIKNLNWASYALGFAVVGLELGFLLAYRAGWNISLGALVANLVVALLLIPVGIYVFKEKLSTINMLGIGLSVVGLVCINYR